MREEISHWRFLDSWTGCAPWRTEEHKVLKLLASDASQSRWGATLSLPGGVESTGDYFGEDLGGHDIAVKEAFALLKALQTFSSHLVNSRVDVLVDNKVLYHAWLRGGCRNQGVNRALKQIFETVLPMNVALHLEWVPSAANPADQPSREWSDSDIKLAPVLGISGISRGPTLPSDLMALDSNSQCHRPYTPCPTPLSTGVNFLAHNPGFDERGREENGYLFPPIYLIGPALQHLLSCHARTTLLVPDIFPRPYWWPVLCRCANGQFLLAEQGTHEVIIWRSKQHGFHQLRKVPLPWNLLIFPIGNKS